MLNIRHIDPRTASDAVEFIAEYIPSIPLYNWVLGSENANPHARAWLARILVEPIASEGGLVGGYINDELVGALLYRTTGATQTNTYTLDIQAEAATVTAWPEMAQRFVWLMSDDHLPAPSTHSIHIALGVVKPSKRTQGVVAQLMQTVEAVQGEREEEFYVWTANPDYRDQWMLRWNCRPFDTRTVAGIDMYGICSTAFANRGNTPLPSPPTSGESRHA